jgi:protein-tyrosine-phosphatase
MAEVLLRRRLDECGVMAHVGSAGFLEAGLPATEEAIATVAKDGYDLGSHRSRIVTVDMVNRADIVVAMSHEHAIELGVMIPDAWSKFFQLRDLLRRADSTGSRRHGRPVSVWLEEIGGGRTRPELLTGDREDDIVDPVGQSLQEYARIKCLLDELLTKLAALLS